MGTLKITSSFINYLFFEILKSIGIKSIKVKFFQIYSEWGSFAPEIEKERLLHCLQQL